ncbi:MAG: hypothetical protein DLM71_03265 [Chloroflexi bacterium]|nr:MAG: hypothetical protein DLM71_03265 [Chloroflexota bacterium]
MPSDGISVGRLMASESSAELVARGETAEAVGTADRVAASVRDPDDWPAVPAWHPARLMAMTAAREMRAALHGWVRPTPDLPRVMVLICLSSAWMTWSRSRRLRERV